MSRTFTCIWSAASIPADWMALSMMGFTVFIGQFFKTKTLSFSSIFFTWFTYLYRYIYKLTNKILQKLINFYSNISRMLPFYKTEVFSLPFFSLGFQFHFPTLKKLKGVSFQPRFERAKRRRNRLSLLQFNHLMSSNPILELHFVAAPRESINFFCCVFCCDILSVGSFFWRDKKPDVTSFQKKKKKIWRKKVRRIGTITTLQH